MNIAKTIVEIVQAAIDIAESAFRVVTCFRSSMIFTIDEENSIREFLADIIDQSNADLFDLDHHFSEAISDHTVQFKISAVHSLIQERARILKEFEERFTALIIQRMKNPFHLERIDALFQQES